MNRGYFVNPMTFGFRTGWEVDRTASVGKTTNEEISNIDLEGNSYYSQFGHGWKNADLFLTLGFAYLKAEGSAANVSPGPLAGAGVRWKYFQNKQMEVGGGVTSTAGHAETSSSSLNWLETELFSGITLQPDKHVSPYINLRLQSLVGKEEFDSTITVDGVSNVETIEFSAANPIGLSIGSQFSIPFSDDYEGMTINVETQLVDQVGLYTGFGFQF